MTWATDKLAAIKGGTSEPPPVVRTLKLGTLDDWGQGSARKRWTSSPEILNGDGSMFGGYIAALADQMLARGEPLIIEARVIAQSRQVITVEADIRLENGDLIAKASAQQIVTPYAPA